MKEVDSPRQCRRLLWLLPHHFSRDVFLGESIGLAVYKTKGDYPEERHEYESLKLEPRAMQPVGQHEEDFLHQAEVVSVAEVVEHLKTNIRMHSTNKVEVRAIFS